MTSARLRRPILCLAAGIALAGCGLPPAERYAAAAGPPVDVPAPQIATPTPGAAAPSTPAPTPLQFTFPTPGPAPVSAWRPPPYPVPWALRPEDHFYFLRPIPSGDVNWPHPRYRYGNTYFGEASVHTGVDLDAARGTPVLAAGPGQVTWVGYGLYSGTYNPKDPYGIAVAIRHDFGYDGHFLYTVYAHLQGTSVWVGQRVQAGEQIGEVGDTGNADGPHLHFEVRLGDDGYFTTRNPELWMVPPEGWGVLAGKVTSTYGLPLAEKLVQIRSLDSGKLWEVWTYAPQTVRPDDKYGENFVISDLPAGPYEVTIGFIGRDFKAQFYLQPGETNLLTFRGREGISFEPTPTPASLSVPPGP